MLVWLWALVLVGTWALGQTGRMERQVEQVNLLARARHHLIGLNSSLDLNFVRLQATESSSPDPLLSRLLIRGQFPSSRSLTALDLLHFKPIGSFRDGMISLSCQRAELYHSPGV